MGIYAPAVKMLIPESDSQSRIVPAGVIVHTNASNGSIETLYNLYQRTTGEAHFQLEVAPPNGKGRLAQYIDTHTRADNNYRANSYTQNGMLKGWISIETADLGDPYTKSFSDLGQRQQLVDLLVWICQTHNIPAVRATDPYGTGIGWHSMWGYNQRGSGSGKYGRFTASDGTEGELNNPWTNTYGKICPGPGPGVAGGKIGEMPSIIAEVASRLNGADDMSQADVDAINAHTDQQIAALRTSVRNDVIGTLRADEFRLNQFGGGAGAIGVTDTDLNAVRDAILVAIGNLDTSSGSGTGPTVDEIVAGVVQVLNETRLNVQPGS